MKRSIVVVSGLLLLLAVSAVGANPSAPVIQQEATYVGSDTCFNCHPALGGGPSREEFEQSLHAWKLRPRDEATIVGTFPVTDTNGVVWTLDDVDYVIGARPKWKQRYIKVIDGVWRILPIQWNLATSEWVPYHADDWADGTPERDYKELCVGCHTTGFDIENPEANGGLGFVDFGIWCEACHGPGSLHVAGGFADPSDKKIVKSVSSEVCAGCHVRGKTKEGLYDVRYGWPEGFYPGSGVALEDVYDLDWGTKRWWFDNPEDAEAPGHAKAHHQQYMEWSLGGHAQALQDIAAFGRDFCLQCHSEDYRRDPENVTFETAEYAVECVSCHATHGAGVEGTSALILSRYETCVQCHNGDLPESGKFEPGEAIHHPMKEMFEGIGFPGVEDMPSPHFAAEGGPVCSSCHFPKTAKSALPGDISSHMQTDGFAVVMPGDAQAGEPDSCTGCHTGATRERMQRIIDNRQAEIHRELEELGTLIEANEAISTTVAYQTAVLALETVEEEGSFGIHNYWYAKAVLAEGFQQLGQAPVESPYAGSDACVGCHSVLTPDVTLEFEDTLHNWKLRPRDEATIVGTFPVTDTNGVPWTLDDVDYVIGARPKWKQRYIKVIDGVWRILPIQWNLATSEWVPYHADDWADGTPERDYKELCVGCHTTGFDIQNPDANGGLGFVDFGITCEACHGPGREHASGGGEIQKSVSSEVCAGCHVRGKTKEGLYDVRYGWPEGFYPGSGVALEDVYDLDWGTKRWWFDNPNDAEDPGHAKAHHQQYMEWGMSAHSGALESLRASGHAQDFCLQCHSEDYRRAPADAKPTVDTAEFSIECVTCHATHTPGAEGTHQLVMSQYETCVQCHNGGLTEGGKFEPGQTVHHPMQEVFEGQGAIGVEDMPSRHFANETGPTCSSCHLVKTAKSAVWVMDGERVVKGDISSHLLKSVEPGHAQAGEPDSCGQCHSGDMQSLIDQRQDDIKSRVAEAESRLAVLGAAAGLEARDSAYTNLTIVESEGSFGIHNYQYSSAILDAIKDFLDQIRQIRLPIVQRSE